MLPLVGKKEGRRGVMLRGLGRADLGSPHLLSASALVGAFQDFYLSNHTAVVEVGSPQASKQMLREFK